ncbi:MAG: DUF2971 domain-containing protein [Bacteroidales bacterium]|nr:DUF2971 domain-containing protein [Bacteroidales bacterium]
MKLYHYTKYNTLVKYILPTMKLKLSSLFNTNDPTEGRPIFVYGEADPNHHNIEQDSLAPKTMYFNEYKKYKFVSFCGNKNNIEGWRISSMWAHYAQNHKGVCIEIDTDKLIVPDTIKGCWIDYNGKFPPPFTREQNIEQYFQDNDKFILYTKSPEWEYEQEYRFISSSEEYLDITGAITHIYCGCRMCSLTQKRINSIGYKTSKIIPSLISRKLSLNGIL